MWCRGVWEGLGKHERKISSKYTKCICDVDNATNGNTKSVKLWSLLSSFSWVAWCWRHQVLSGKKDDGVDTTDVIPWARQNPDPALWVGPCSAFQLLQFLLSQLLFLKVRQSHSLFKGGIKNKHITEHCHCHCQLNQRWCDYWQETPRSRLFGISSWKGRVPGH